MTGKGQDVHDKHGGFGSSSAGQSCSFSSSWGQKQFVTNSNDNKLGGVRVGLKDSAIIFFGIAYNIYNICMEFTLP